MEWVQLLLVLLVSYRPLAHAICLRPPNLPYAPKHVSGSECALIGLLENILAPLWVFARFGDVPSAWTVAGGALLLATLIGHEVAAREPVRVSQPGARGYRTVNNL